MATSTNTATFLPPVEKPKGLFLKLGYCFMRKKFGKVMTPPSVFSARMPTAFSLFYGKISKLDRKLQLSPDTVLLLRERVSSINGCLFCMDTNRAAALDKSTDNEAKFDSLEQYRTSPLFTDAERSVLYNINNIGLNIGSDGFCEISAENDRHPHIIRSAP